MKSILQKTVTKTMLLFLIFMSFLNASGQTPLPHYDGLDYAAAAALQTQTGWTSLNTGDNLLISSGSLSYSGLPTSTGNKVTFDGGGIDTAKLFTQQTTGKVYYSFLLNVTALGSLNATEAISQGLQKVHRLVFLELLFGHDWMEQVLILE